MADEGIERQIVERLRQDGHEVLYIAEIEPGLSDEDVFDLAVEQDSILVTADKDFGDLVFRQGRATSGVVLVRLHGTPPFYKAETVLSMIRRRADEITGHFVVVAQGTVRIRKMG